MGPRLCPVVAWAVWTINPTLNRNAEGPGEIPGLFLGAPSMGIDLEVGAARAAYHVQKMY
jgi:hypothetical protein